MVETPGDSGYGFKNLDPHGRPHPSRRDGSDVMQSDLPKAGEKWGPWQTHPNPAEPDGRGCGPGRYHVWRRLHSLYVAHDWWPWFVQWRGLIGWDANKVGVRELRLRRIEPKVLWRGLRLGWGWRVSLSRLDLCDADLHGANLCAADLFYSDLCNANLRDAVLWDADLSNVDLSGADLYGADLHNKKLHTAYLTHAKLKGAKYDRGTIWPDGFDPDAHGCIKVD